MPDDLTSVAVEASGGTALIGGAVMLLWYDIAPEAVAEHDEWHTREHFPERVGVPGFLRAQRWVAMAGTTPRYLISYEVRDLAVLTSDDYRQRLDHPSAWTRRMMPHFRGMVRGFCRYGLRTGEVLGAELLAVRHALQPGRADDFADWLARDALPAIARQPGYASVCTLVAEGAPPMTAEQRLRGRDASVERVLLVSGHAPAFVSGLAGGMLAPEVLARQGATNASVGCYRLACRADAASLAGCEQVAPAGYRAGVDRS